METTTRAMWASSLFGSEAEFIAAQERGEADGLILLYDEDGNPYIDEGECEGPFAS